MRYIVAPSGEIASKKNAPRSETMLRRRIFTGFTRAKRLRAGSSECVLWASTRVWPPALTPAVVPSNATMGMPQDPRSDTNPFTVPLGASICATAVPPGAGSATYRSEPHVTPAPPCETPAEGAPSAYAVPPPMSTATAAATTAVRILMLDLLRLA